MMHANESANGRLATALYGLLHAMKSTRHDDPVDRSAIIVMARLHDQGALRLSDLASDLCLDVSTMSRHARTIEERGYITREGDPTDGRAVRLTLTDAGRAVLAAAYENRQAWLEESLADWSKADREQLTRTLERLTEALTPPTTNRDRQEKSA
jgi:DNA-binding MarR family transcriptional regulator